MQKCDKMKNGQVAASSGDRLALSGGAEGRPEGVTFGPEHPGEPPVTDYTPKLDMSTIPDDVLYSELGRRREAMRKERHGKEKVMRPCPHCGLEYGAREMRAHVPKCPRRRR